MWRCGARSFASDAQVCWNLAAGIVFLDLAEDALIA
jgi:hypothetical protein